MKRLNRLTRATALAAGGIAISASAAVANVEIGGTAGIHVFNNDSEQGVADAPEATSMRNSALFGIRLGYTFTDMLGVEAEVGLIPTEGRSMVFDVWNVTYRAHIIAQFRAENPANKVVPFVVLGGGIMHTVKSDNENVIRKDKDENFYAGIGAKYRVDHGFGIRLDGRILIPPSSAGDSVTTDFEALLSVYKEWGRAAGAEEPEKKPEPTGPADTDGDGLADDVDKCVTEAEDMDGFQDDDGCPDADNDGDGVLDGNDRCGTEAEDMDGFQDDDGCPDADNDGDGLADASDKCPIEAEDKDGFQDDDGCPDADNDGDGVADADDKCPDQMETKNGFEDSDGCADEIPKALVKYTGVIKGINFKSGSADILKSSNKTLDATVKILNEYPDLRVEIQGHTDDQAPKAGAAFADNTALSQARADAVKAYIVAKGITEDRLVAKGYGETVPLIEKKTAAARAKNRRVQFKLLSDLQN